MPYRPGLEAWIRRPSLPLEKQDFGLVCNLASVDRSLHYASEILAARFPGRLRAIFSPQHGFFAEQQDNMVESPHGRDPLLGIPIYSLYSESRKPKREWIEALDALVIDLQDVGTRVYTFIWTLYHCLEVCAELGKRVYVLDRPNPLGSVVEGPSLLPEFRSFVGLARIPMRHGLSIGELARHFVRTEGWSLPLEVIPCEDWHRDSIWQDLLRNWVPTSPNLPRVEALFVYPGQVLLEGTNLSEGRGTTTPFEVLGAPFLDPWALLERLGRDSQPGLLLRPLRFVPTFQKHADKSCGGLFLHVIDPDEVRSYRSTIAILAACMELWPDEFAWREPPYEYEEKIAPIDILSGSDRLRTKLRDGTDTDTIDALAAVDFEAWSSAVEADLLYEGELRAP